MFVIPKNFYRVNFLFTDFIFTITILLGHSSIDCSQRYVDVNHDTLCEMFADAIEDGEC